MMESDDDMPQDPSIRSRQVQKQGTPTCQGENEHNLGVDVKYLMKELRGIKHKWYKIGKALEIPDKVLQSIDDDEKKLLCVIEELVNGQTQVGQNVLKKIAQALRDSEVKEEELANKLERISEKSRQGRWCPVSCLTFFASIIVIFAIFLCVMYPDKLAPKLKFGSHEGESICILVAGKSGSGKSAIINGIIGENVTEEDNSFDAPIYDVQQYMRKVQGVSIIIFDLSDIENESEERVKSLQDKLQVCKNFNLVLYAIRMTDMRVHAEDTEAIKILTKAFGFDIWNKAMFTMTFANEVRYPEDPFDALETKKYYNKRLQDWKHMLPTVIEERAKVPAHIARSIPIIPTGYYKARDLPEANYWFSRLWMAAINRMKESGGNGANSMQDFVGDRLKYSNEITGEDFKKPIHKQPILRHMEPSE